MPGGGGLAATERLARDAPHVAVLVLTMSAEDASVTAALRAGARGYLVKGASRAEVERALRTVAEGGVVVGASVAHRVAALVGGARRRAEPALADLSAREREVLDLMARGLDNARDRPAAGAQPQDRAQRGVGDLRQAAHVRPRPGRPPGAGGGARHRPGTVPP